MEFFDIRKMPVNLWRNGAGETREICCFPPATRDFNWRASIASLASNGDFSVSPGVDRVITLLEGGEVHLDGGKAFNHTLRRHQPFSFAGELPVKAQRDNLLSGDQGACWHEGDHTLRLLKDEGTLLFSEIFWLPGH